MANQLTLHRAVHLTSHRTVQLTLYRKGAAAAPLRVKLKLGRSAIIIFGLVGCREIPLPFQSHMALAKGGALWVCAF